MQIILATPKIVLKEITEEEFNTKVYNNEGIQDPKIKGFMRYGLNKDSIEFYQIYVHPDHRKEGIGTLLVDTFEKIGKKNKKEKAIIYSGTSAGETFGDFILSKGYVSTKSKWFEKKI